MATRKLYSREFKLETVKLVTERGMSRTQVARDMGMHVTKNWPTCGAKMSHSARSVRS